MILNKNQTYIIAEAGVNHNGDMRLARKLILSAKKCGANAIKFQNFSAENLVTKSAKKAPYQIKNTKNNNSQFLMLKKLQLKKKNYFELIKLCKKEKIDFLSSVFDEYSIDFLYKDLKINTIKIPSGEINNYLILNGLNIKKHKILLSTGMSDFKDISYALNTISKRKVYSVKNNNVKILNQRNHKKIKSKIILLHCITDYPVKDKFANLECITNLKNQFKLEVGYSDHTLGIAAPLFAVSRGALVIEKHFTLDKKMKGPDHLASLSPTEFKHMVNDIRRLENMKGNGVKKLEQCEIKNVKVVRKSLVAKKNILKGEKFTLLNLTAKRPGYGLPASKIVNYLGKRAKKNYQTDDLI